jgi:hypothetical protein
MPLSPQRIRERGFNQVLELLSVIKRKQQVMKTINKPIAGHYNKNLVVVVWNSLPAILFLLGIVLSLVFWLWSLHQLSRLWVYIEFKLWRKKNA